MSTANKIDNSRLSPNTVRINGADAIEHIRAWLLDAGYAESATRALTRGTPQDQDAAQKASELPEVQLLLAGSPLPAAQAKALFTVDDLKEWVAAGLLAKTRKEVLPLVRIMPFRGLLVVSDCEHAAQARSHPDLVMGLTGSSSRLADFIIPADSQCTLDMGTGAGITAMLAARHSKQVVATDVNPRALEFARFNAALNEIDNIEFIEGDMFGAVEGRTFDLILSKPLFPVSPAKGCRYSENPSGDESIRHFAQTAPSYLNNGGYAQIVHNWVQRNGDDWPDRVSGWLKTSGCDAWVVRGMSSSPADYGRKWLEGYDTANVEKLLGAWIADCEKQGIASIDGGLITMRRSEAQQNWVRVDSELPRIFPDAGVHVARCFGLQDFLNRVPGSDLLNEILYLSPSVELTQTCKSTMKGMKLQRCEITMTRGIAYSMTLDPAIARVVTSCNGRLQLGQLMQAVAMEDGEELEVVVAHYLGAIRRLVMLGFLWPARRGTLGTVSALEESKPGQAEPEAGPDDAKVDSSATAKEAMPNEKVAKAGNSKGKTASRN
ncbi:MAG: methyltransferase [Gammaproteobacteria bacterium]|nr:methyltransferase [Gammaproteobacteria bacterium]